MGKTVVYARKEDIYSRTGLYDQGESDKVMDDLIKNKGYREVSRIKEGLTTKETLTDEELNEYLIQGSKQ